MTFNAKVSLRRWKRKAAYRLARERYWIKRRNKFKVKHWARLRKTADSMVARRQDQLSTVGSRAWTVAGSLLAVREVGGNNVGPMVTKIIRANGGTGPEPWCGDFVAYCYTLARSKAVQRGWAATTLIGRLQGLTVIPLDQAHQGDILVFDFGTGTPEHMGLYGKRLPGGALQTREGNTTNAGADNVSDAGSTSDGVYEKTNRRPSDVYQCLRVTR